jgi:hypothetical protein
MHTIDSLFRLLLYHVLGKGGVRLSPIVLFFIQTRGRGRKGLVPASFFESKRA